MSPRWANVLTFLGLAALFAGVSLTAPRWARFLRQPLPVAGPAAEATEAGGSQALAPAPEPQAERKISVKLFFEATDRQGLVLEEREIQFSSDLARQLRVVVEELIRGSQAGLVSAFAPEARVLEVFVTARGVAYVDLSREAALGQLSGSKAELMAVYSIVNTITVNFPSVSRVQILVQDQPSATLAGHVDLLRPLPPDMTLLAAADLTPVTLPGREGAASPGVASSPQS